MKNFINKTLLLAICSSAVIGCKPKFDEVPAPSAGTADFSKFVTIGDGTAGGYADASLNRESQLAAFPNILAEQFKLVGGGEFNLPLVLPYYSTVTKNTYTSFGFENNKPYTKYELRYRTFCDGKTELYPTMEDSSIFLKSDLFAILGFKVEPPPAGGGYNNFAAQGTKMIYINKKPGWFHAPKTSSTAATYWQKISSTLATAGTGASTMLLDAVAQKPTFVCINAGPVDVMRYAKSGGNQDNGDDDMITPVDEFRDSLYSILNTFKASNPNIKGAIANIIDLNSFPYFTYIKYNGLILDDAQAKDLNTFYGGQFSFQKGKNAYVISDPSSPNGKRQIKGNEYIIIEIPQDSLRCFNLGGRNPIRGRWVLDEAEIANVNAAVSSFNAVTKAAAAAYNFAYVDGNASMKRVVARTYFQGIKLTSDMIIGNEFTVDGLNISPFGQVLLANNYIGEINLKYGSTIPFADATKVRAVLFH